MENKLVSVIIPFYNGASWLDEAIESVLQQTHKNFEIIVINDGSLEDLTSVINKYREKVKFISKKNGGPASARNIGIKQCFGDYIAFLDSDDIWLPTKTAEQLRFMEERGIIWSHTGYCNWYPEEDRFVYKCNANDYGDVYVRSFLSLKAPTPAIMIKRDYLIHHNDFYFFEDMRYSEDSALWSKIAKNYKLGLVNKTLVKVRQRGTNADLFATIRFKSKSAIYSKIKDGVFPNLPYFIIFICKIYLMGDKVIEFIEKKLKLNNGLVEFIGKCLWSIPFVLERIYLLTLESKKDKKYIK
jgi:glycosyltransferase involved in cell wall biosynthesis